MHNLGGVQLSAPHSSGGWHCVDEYDLMCYSDSPKYPPMQYICVVAHENRFDCGHDDYFSTSPPAGGYLATHWNAANNQFLVGAAPPPCPDAAYEPDDTAAQARPLTVGNAEQHAFCVSYDEDWGRFSATAGTRYTVETLNLSAGTDTVLDLLGSDGRTVLAHNDDSNGTASQLSYTPTGYSTLYVRVTQHDGSTGSPGRTYDLRIGSCLPSLVSSGTTPRAVAVGVTYAKTMTYSATVDATCPAARTVDVTMSHGTGSAFLRLARTTNPCPVDRQPDVVPLVAYERCGRDLELSRQGRREQLQRSVLLPPAVFRHSEPRRQPGAGAEGHHDHGDRQAGQSELGRRSLPRVSRAAR
jgi:hypothetical protein